jgi:ferredoxin
MADPLDRTAENVSGPFFVDSTCIDCGLCREIAPRFFALSAESGLSYVQTQPFSSEDTVLAQQAMDQCPTESIGRE